MRSARLAVAPLALLVSFVTSLAMFLATSLVTARPAAAGELEFVIPDGFSVIARSGQPTADALKSATLAQLAHTPGLALYAARLAPDGSVMGTFQVLIKDRPFVFDATTLDRFASEITGEMNQGGMPPKITNKAVITVAGEAAARVVVVSQQRRMMFVGVPDGRRTALLLYAASENDFPTLYPDFERSVSATHHGRSAPAIAAPAPPVPWPTPPPPSSPTPSPLATSEARPVSSWLAVLPWAVGVALLVGWVLVRASRSPAPDEPDGRPARRGRRR